MKKACIIFSSQIIFCYHFPLIHKKKNHYFYKKNPLLRQKIIFLLVSRIFFNFDPDCKRLIKKTFSTLLPLCPLDTPMVLIILMIALMTSLLASAQTSVALVILVFSICKKIRVTQSVQYNTGFFTGIWCRSVGWKNLG